LIFADEPSSRLDLITQKEMIELLVEAASESQTAVLLVSHDEALIDAVSDQRIHLGTPEQNAITTQHADLHDCPPRMSQQA
jgi:peptide/nickel transport system ATP-binding protein